MTNSNDDVSRHTGDPALDMVDMELRSRGFLTDDDPHVARIIDSDTSGLARLGLDLSEACDLMWQMYNEGNTGLGEPVTVDERFKVSVREDRGIIACPWRDHYAARKAIVYATNLQSGKELKFSVLGLHMICSHGFFQAKGNPFRINPSVLKEFFQD
jgi:hypothetical protein